MPTNKIFAYAQTGLYILATNTSAQKQFMEQHPDSGILSGQTIEEMEEAVEHIIKNIDLKRKENRFEYP